METKPSSLPPWKQFLQAPLFPLAIALTLGILFDRIFSVEVTILFPVVVAGFIVWWMQSRKVRLQPIPNHRDAIVGMLGLLLSCATLAAIYHQAFTTIRNPNDISFIVQNGSQLARIRGVIVEEPSLIRSNRSDPFYPTRKPDRGSTILEVQQIQGSENWQPTCGKVRLNVDRAIEPDQPFALDSIRVGDVVEVVGMLFRYPGPANPGEIDLSQMMRDRQISAELRITKSADAIVRWESGSGFSITALLASMRGRTSRIIDQALPEREASLAKALLLGDGTAMEHAEWDVFVRTGVVHVLAISGQHLVVLAGFFWWLVRVLGLQRNHAAWFIIVLVLSYAGMTGLRPSAIRAAIMVSVACMGLIRRRPLHTANGFLLSWIIVLLINPTDVVSTGNVLSFLSVFALIWGAAIWLEPIRQSSNEEWDELFYPKFYLVMRKFLRSFLMLYAVNAILFISNAPFIAARQNLLTPVGLLVGPPLILLTEIALISGFAMLIFGSLHPNFVYPFAKFSEWSLSACGKLVKYADSLPGGSIYLPSPANWWLIGFYILGFLIVLIPELRRRCLIGLLAWSVLLLLPNRGTVDELRLTFVAVGHGSCTVVECPDGRVLVYDVGTLVGPDAVKRSVAPFLWSRGIRKIDELFLSHADLDHFNGISELLRRFPVGQVTMTNSFADKPTQEVAAALLAIKRYEIPMRTAAAGEQLNAGLVTIRVLHPPRDGFAGSENERSLVLRIEYLGHSILLTGDLEKQGTRQFLETVNQPVDIVMAPHHGSKSAWSQAFVNSTRPRFVVVNRGYREPSRVSTGDAGVGVEVWDTANEGAITIRCHQTGITAESFRMGTRMVVKRGLQ